MLSVGAIQILIMLLGLLRSKFLSVVLGPAGLGLVGTIDQLVLAFVSLGALGLPFAALKWMARSHSEGPEPFQRTYAGFLWALGLLGLATGAIGVSIGVFAPTLLGHELAPYRWLIAIAMLGIPASMLNILLANALAASQRGSKSALFSLVIQGVLLSATIVGVWLGGTRGLYIATVSAGAFATIAFILLLNRIFGRPSRAGAGWLVSEFRQNPTVVTYSVWVYAAGAVYALVMSGMRTVVFSEFGAADAGLLQAALSLALTVGAVISPMSNLLLTPLVNRSIPAKEKVDVANEFAGRVVTLLTIAALPLLLYPRFAIGLLFARGFLTAAGFLYAFIVWQCLAQLVNVYTQLLIGLDDVAFACAAICVSYGAALLLAKPFMVLTGVPGVAAALITGTVFCGIVNTVRLKSKFNAAVSKKVGLRLVTSLVILGSAAAVSYIWTEQSAAGTAIRVALVVVVLALQWRLLDAAELGWARLQFDRVFARNGSQ